ncbi:MAG: cation:dicarboxylase symporter family transporter [Bacteroidetes bacterium]|nr:cation:dicarboxylase symporter family transporter [Bacteroidota bacterium]
MKKINLTVQIIIAMISGIILGQVYRTIYPDAALQKNFASNIQVLSDIFLRLVKMIIAPLVFSLLLTGIAKAGDFKTVGRIGLKTLSYFLGATLLALITGLVMVNLFKPGSALNLQAVTPSNTNQVHRFNLRDFVSHIFPESIVKAMAQNEILPIIIFVLFFAVATAAIQERGKMILDFFDAVGHVMLKVTSYVMKLAPIGVFGATTAVITEQGLSILGAYAEIILSFFLGLLIFIFVILYGICLIARIPFFRLLAHVREPMLLAFTTASSEAAMPKVILGLERFGLSNRIVSFVLPLGYSFNLDGSIMYMIFATISIAQAYGMNISFEQQIIMMLVLMITSKGVAGVPRASLVVIAGMLTMFAIPAEGLTLLLAIDWLLDMGRACTNVIGNAVATCVVSKWEGEVIDHHQKK